MTTLHELLSAHHTTCDDLFADAEAAASDGDWASCRRQVERFAQALTKHFSAEEEILFPSYEAATGMSAGPTAVMRSEHAQMRTLVDALQNAAGSEDADAYFGASETLLIFMEQHNRKEEGILYPMCDQSIPGATALAGDIRPVLEC